VRRRPQSDVASSDFLPCEYCYAFFRKPVLWKHVRCCHFRGTRSDEFSPLSVIARSQVLLDSARPVPLNEENATVQELIFDKMRNDDVKMQAEGDSLIKSLACVLLKRLGSKKVSDISRRVRQLGRLRLQLRNDHKSKGATASRFQLTDYISGTHFDTVIKSVENLCGITRDRSGHCSVQKPSLALKLGHSLGKLARLKKGLAFRNGDATVRQQAEAFASLLDTEYNDLVSSVSLATLRQNKYNKVEDLPLTEDLVKLRNYQEQLMQELKGQLQEKKDYDSYRRLLEVVLCRLIVFNKRRAGEAARLMVTAYTERPDWHAVANSEIVRSLQPLEQQMFSRLDMVQLPGKRGRRVPMLFTEDMRSAMDILVASRDVVGIPNSNPYFFAIQSTEGYLGAWHVMNDIAKAAGCAQPQLITSTKLRKYISTVAQILNLEKGEVEWLANHLGHDLDVHKSFYRLHESTVELSKVSRLLLAVDSGCVSEYSGKKLSEVTVATSPNVDVEPDSEQDDIDALLADSRSVPSTSKQHIKGPPAIGLLELQKQRMAKRKKCAEPKDNDDSDVDPACVPSTSKWHIKSPPATGLLELQKQRMAKRKKCA